MIVTLTLFLAAPLRYLKLVSEGERLSVITPFGVVNISGGTNEEEAWREERREDTGDVHR